jgi:hypothetical protein
MDFLAFDSYQILGLPLLDEFCALELALIGVVDGKACLHILSHTIKMHLKWLVSQPRIQLRDTIIW